MGDLIERDDLYTEAKAHPVASIILNALHAQDARTYHGQSGDIGTLALDAAKAVEEVVRVDERRRLADLLEENAETLGGYTGEGSKTVQLVAFMLRLKDDSGEQKGSGGRDHQAENEAIAHVVNRKHRGR